MKFALWIYFECTQIQKFPCILFPLVFIVDQINVSITVLRFSFGSISLLITVDIDMFSSKDSTDSSPTSALSVISYIRPPNVCLLCSLSTYMEFDMARHGYFPGYSLLSQEIVDFIVLDFICKFF